VTRLRSLLLAWLLIPSLVLWALAFAVGYWRSLAQAHEAYDRTLLGSALVVGERLEVVDGKISADLPYSALEMLRTDSQDRIFYRVTDRASGRHITGYEDLPPPERVAHDEPQFYDRVYRGQDIRLVAVPRTVVDATGQRQLLVQVAETMDARRQLTSRIVVESAAMQLLLIVMAAGLIALGVQRGLSPLKRLRAEVRARGANDLTPIDTRSVPREVAPLIHAINVHTERQRQLSDSQVRFVANASHQLKTPLTLLRAQVDHALQQPDLERVRGVLGDLQAATLATQRLVGQLLGLARSEPGRVLQIEAFDLTALAREVAFEMVALARQRSIDLGFEGEAAVQVSGERMLWRESIANLVHNALTYTPEGGKVTVGVSCPDGMPRLHVIDSGPGIAPAERTRVFERFYRGDGAHAPGSGLGLTIVKEVCDQHGVHVTLADGPNSRGLDVGLEWRR
jgi:two-component system, OmpR family, sensor histidine kinase TctE